MTRLYVAAIVAATVVLSETTSPLSELKTVIVPTWSLFNEQQSPIQSTEYAVTRESTSTTDISFPNDRIENGSTARVLHSSHRQSGSVIFALKSGDSHVSDGSKSTFHSSEKDVRDEEHTKSDHKQTESSAASPGPRHSSSLEGEGTPDTTYHPLLMELFHLSDGVYSTDYAVVTIASLFFVTSITSPCYKFETSYLQWAFAGTAIAHFYGGIMHQHFYSSAITGHPKVGYYAMEIISFGGKCLAYGKGWGLDRKTETATPCPTLSSLPYVALLNFLYLLFIGLFVTIHKGPATHAPMNSGYIPDYLFVAGQAFTVVIEVIVAIAFLIKYKTDVYAVFASSFYIFGWLSIYGTFVLSTSLHLKYHADTCLRVYNYCMIAVMWAFNSFAVEGEEQTPPLARNNSREGRKSQTGGMEERTKVEEEDDVVVTTTTYQYESTEPASLDALSDYI